MFTLADAARQTLPDFAQLDDFGDYRNRRTRQDLYAFMMMWYGLTAIAVFLVFIMGVMAVVNTVRFVTSTGLKDPDVW